uniref:Uncharacterized protein n=1 Tax=Cacopsylla melanoneura TaxID=428564 RepID=A0A8D8Y416_9HEMI
MLCQPGITLTWALLAGVLFLQIIHCEESAGPVLTNATATGSVYQYVQNFLSEILYPLPSNGNTGQSQQQKQVGNCRPKGKNRGKKNEYQIDCIEDGKAEEDEEGRPLAQNQKHFVNNKKPLAVDWHAKDMSFVNQLNGTIHNIVKRQAAGYFQHRTDEELDYRDHWQLGLKEAFFNTLTYVEKRIQDDEKRYKLWMKIKRSRFLKRKLLMATDDLAENNKYGVIINRNVKFEIRQTDSAIYECISKTCKPDPDVTAVWKIRTIDSENVERDDDILLRGSEHDDEYYGSGSRRRNVRYRSSNNRRLGRWRRQTSNGKYNFRNSPNIRDGTRRSKRDVNEKIIDNFNIEDKLTSVNELSEAEVIRFKRNRSIFEQQNNKMNRMNNNGQLFQTQNQRVPQQTTQRLFPAHDLYAANPAAYVLNANPWKPMLSQIYPSNDGRGYSGGQRFLEDQALEFLSAREKDKIPVNSFEEARSSTSNTQGVLDSWNVQPIIISNEYSTPKVVRILPTDGIPKEELNFLRQTLPKNYDLSGLQLELPAIRNAIKERIPLEQQTYLKSNNQQQYVKIPIPPIRDSEEPSPERLEDNKSKFYSSGKYVSPNIQTIHAPAQYERQEDTFEKPWMSFRIQNPSASMVGENSAHYTKILTVPSKAHIETPQNQNLQSNPKQIKARLIDDTNLNIQNIPTSRFKSDQEFTSKNIPHDGRLPQATLQHTRIDNIDFPNNSNTPKSERNEQPIYQNNDREQAKKEQYEKSRPFEHFKPEHDMEIRWSQLPPVKPNINDERRNPSKEDHLSKHQELPKSRNINSYEHVSENPRESPTEQKIKGNAQLEEYDTIKPDVESPKHPEASTQKHNVQIVQSTTERSAQGNSQTNTDPNQNKLVTSSTPEMTALIQDENEEGEEGDEYDEEYDDYEDEYEDTDEEPQIIKTSIQHCKALAKNTAILSRSKNLKFAIKPMLIFFKTNFDSFVKEHCYLYTTAKDLKILNNDLNLESEERKKKRILRSNKNSPKPNKRNFKKKYKGKNYKRYRNDGYDQFEDEVYRDSFEAYGKKRTNESKLHKSFQDPEYDDIITESDLKTGHKNNKDIPPAHKKHIHSMHRFFDPQNDPISPLDLEGINFEDNVQNIRRIDDGDYRIIIFPKTLLRVNVDKNGKDTMQSRSDDVEEIEYIEDTNESFLKNTKNFRFPSEGSVTRDKDKVNLDPFVENRSKPKSNLERVTEKFTLEDLPSSDHHKTFAQNRKDKNQPTEKTVVGTFKFPEPEYFFNNSPTDRFFKTQETNKDSEVNMFRPIQPENVEKKVFQINLKLGSDLLNNSNQQTKDKLIKPKGQVIDEVIYLPNHELFTPHQQKHKFSGTAKKQSNSHNIPSFENNRNITLSSQIFVGKHADKNMEEFFRSIEDGDGEIETSQGTSKESGRHTSNSINTMNRREDKVSSTESFPNKSEFGPVLKDGFLPIMPMVVDRSSSPENMSGIITSETVKNLPLKETIQLSFRSRLKSSDRPYEQVHLGTTPSTSTNASISTKHTRIKPTSYFSEPLLMNLFDKSAFNTSGKSRGSTTVKSFVGNQSLTDTTNQTNVKVDNFKPSYPFTKFSEPDPMFDQMNGTLVEEALETQTEDGQVVYATQSSRVAMVKKPNDKLHQSDVIKIIQKDFIHPVEDKTNYTRHEPDAVKIVQKEFIRPLEEKVDIRANQRNISHREIESYKRQTNHSSQPERINFNQIVHLNLTDKLSQVPQNTLFYMKKESVNGNLQTSSGTLYKQSIRIPPENKTSHGLSGTTISTIENNSTPLPYHSKNITIDEKDSEKNENFKDLENKKDMASNIMQLFQSDGERGKDNQRDSHEISNKTSVKNEKEIQTLRGDKRYSEYAIHQDVSIKTVEEENGNKQKSNSGESLIQPLDEILMRNIKNQRERQFLERNIQKHAMSSRADENIDELYDSEHPTNLEATTFSNDLTTTDSSLFLYKTVISIIEKTPGSNKNEIEIPLEKNVYEDMLPTIMPTEIAEKTNKEMSEPIKDVMIKESETNLNNTSTNKINAKVSYLFHESVSSTVGPVYNRSHEPQSTSRVEKELLQTNITNLKQNIDQFNNKDNTARSGNTPEESENLIKNIIAESLKSYSSSNFTKGTVKPDSRKSIHSSKLISNQFLKATTFHPLHFRSADEDRKVVSKNQQPYL